MSFVIHSGERSLDRATLNTRAARIASGFAALGVEPGAVVATVLRNDLAFFEVVYATRAAGAHLVPINWHFTAEEVGYILRDSGARVLVVHTDLLDPLVAAVPANVTVLAVPTPPEIVEAYGLADPVARTPRACDWNAWFESLSEEPVDASTSGGTMLYTSGTTGRPKGVRRWPMTDEEAAHHQATISFAFGLRAGLRAVMTGPLYHSAPLGYSMASLAHGADLVLTPRFDAHDFLALVESRRITHAHVVPTMMVRMLRLPESVREGYDLSSLECLAHGAAPCPVEIKRRMIEWLGPVVREYYGSTEASLSAAVDSTEWLKRPGTVGRAVPGARIEIYDEDGRRLGPGEIGEIYTVCASTPEFTYHNRDAERAEIERDGLFTAGDVGYLDEAGYLFICDRKRDMIISGGVNIYPAEIEAALLDHGDVKDCGVFGIPDLEYGESVAAAVECEPGRRPSATDLQSFLRDRIARYKVPRTITFHASLPRLDNGKLYKHALRAPYWENPSQRD